MNIKNNKIWFFIVSYFFGPIVSILYIIIIGAKQFNDNPPFLLIILNPMAHLSKASGLGDGLIEFLLFLIGIVLYIIPYMLTFLKNKNISLILIILFYILVGIFTDFIYFLPIYIMPFFLMGLYKLYILIKK